MNIFRKDAVIPIPTNYITDVTLNVPLRGRRSQSELI